MVTFLSAFDISVPGDDDGEKHVTPVSFILFSNALFTTGWLVAIALGIL
jgi:hypothetical protein